MFGRHLMFPKKREVIEQEIKSYRIQPGEYFPWKGFLFKITEVNEKGFSAETVGVTKKLAHLIKKGNG